MSTSPPTEPSPTDVSTPRTYLGWSLAATVLCFLPVGLVALYFGLKTAKAIEEDRRADAAKSSRLAREMLIAAVAIGAVIYLVFVVVFVALGAFSA